MSDSNEQANNDWIPSRTVDTPTKLYTGGCHCGRFAFECRHPILEDGFEVARCNCSICVQKGYLAIYIPDPKDSFKLTKGVYAELARYTFHTGVVAHLFCPTCGCGLFADMKTMVGVNVCSIKNLDVELEDLTLKKLDGRAL